MQLRMGPIHESVAVCNTRYLSGPSPKKVHQDARKFVEIIMKQPENSLSREEKDKQPDLPRKYLKNPPTNL